jgi:hypothetical protein
MFAWLKTPFFEDWPLNLEGDGSQPPKEEHFGKVRVARTFLHSLLKPTFSVTLGKIIDEVTCKSCC